MTVMSLGEARLINGQVISFVCTSGKQEEVRGLLSTVIHEMRFPSTHNISHGGYGRYSRFKIKQHKYAGGHGGYLEVLEIEDAPDGRANFVIYHYEVSGISVFTEWDTLKSAKKAYEKFWSVRNMRDEYPKLEGFKRLVECAADNPWFYAVGNEELVGDYVVPSGIEDDPVFRLGRKFLVEDDEGNFSVKTCMGCRFYKGPGMYGRRESDLELRLIYWDDGTVWRREMNEKVSARPLEMGEEWIAEALSQFRSLLAGKTTSFEILFLNGGRFTGRLKLEGKITKGGRAGNYLLAVSIRGEKKPRTGWVNDFVPTPQVTNIVQYVTGILEQQGKTVSSVRIKKFKSPTGEKKRWAGVFVKPPA